MIRMQTIRYKARSIFFLIRPEFLVFPILMFFIGVMAADPDDVLEAPYMAALAAVILVQISARLINEYFDWKGDRFARKSIFAGGSGEVSTGHLEPSTALSLGIATVSVAVALGIYVNSELPDRELFLPLLILSAFAAWACSVKPLSLINTGFGELVSTVLLVWAVPLMSGYLVTGNVVEDAIPYLAIISFFALAAAIGTEFPDRQSDIRSAKRNLTYRFGIKATAEVQAVVLFTGYALTFAMVMIGAIGWINLFVLITAIWGWAAVTLMVMPRYYDYEWARSASNVATFVLAVSMALALIDVTAM